MDPWPCCFVPCGVANRVGSKRFAPSPCMSCPDTFMVHSHHIIWQPRDSGGCWIADPQPCLGVAWYVPLVSPARAPSTSCELYYTRYRGGCRQFYVGLCFNHGIIDTAQHRPLNHFRSTQGYRVHCQYNQHYLPPPEFSILYNGNPLGMMVHAFLFFLY